MKLLSRTIRNYLLYSTLLVVLSTPLFYMAIRQLVIYEMDKVLRSHKKDFNESLAFLTTEPDRKLYHLINKEFILSPTDKLPAHDAFYTIDLYDSAERKLVPYRVLLTGVVIEGKRYELTIQESMVSSGELIITITCIQLLMVLGLLIGTSLINRKLSRTIWGPFYFIIDQLKKFNIDNDNLRLPQTYTKEFRDLNETIQLLVRRNQEAYRSQKEFTSNASHELQTPLAISRTKLELLAQTRELTSEQSDLVGSLLDTNNRLIRLNKDLLLLSRIENRQFIESTDVDLTSVIAATLTNFEHMIESKGLVVTTPPTKNILIKTNQMMLEVLTANLISNAIKYTPSGGKINIVSTTKQLTISNSGHPLKEPGKIFDRFYRETRTETGSGLGLSIVAKICEVAGFGMEYKYSRKMHQFSVTFHKTT